MLGGCGKNKQEATTEIPMMQDSESNTPQKEMDITVCKTQGSDYTIYKKGKSIIL